MFAGTSQLAGQSPAVIARSVGLAASGDLLPAALTRVDSMLTNGDLDISHLHSDTMLTGRVMERLGQFHAGLPVFGGQVVRQMDGRAIVSVTGRLYEAIDVDVNPSISPERAGQVAVAAAGSGANIKGETTLGILPTRLVTASCIAWSCSVSGRSARSTSMHARVRSCSPSTASRRRPPSGKATACSARSGK